MATQSRTQRRKWIVIGTVAALVLGLGGLATGVAKSRYFRHQHVLFDPAVIESLDLQPEQQAALEDLRRRAEADRGQGWKEMQSVRAVFEEERDAEEPDLRSVVAKMEERVRAVWTGKEALVGEALEFYESLSPEQKRSVVDALGERMDRFHGMRGHGRGHGDPRGSEGWLGRHGRAAHGQGPEAAAEFHLERMDDRLKLTDSQREAVAAIIDSQESRLAEAVDRLQDNRNQLRNLVEQGSYDQAALRALAEERGQVVADVTVVRTLMRSEIRAQLDVEQRNALDEMHEQRHRWQGMM